MAIPLLHAYSNTIIMQSICAYGLGQFQCILTKCILMGSFVIIHEITLEQSILCYKGHVFIIK